MLGLVGLRFRVRDKVRVIVMDRVGVRVRGARISLFGIRILSVSVYQFSRNCRHAKS